MKAIAVGSSRLLSIRLIDPFISSDLSNRPTLTIIGLIQGKSKQREFI